MAVSPRPWLVSPTSPARPTTRPGTGSEADTSRQAHGARAQLRVRPTPAPTTARRLLTEGVAKETIPVAPRLRSANDRAPRQLAPDAGDTDTEAHTAAPAPVSP